VCVDHTLHAGLDDLLRASQAHIIDDPDRLVRAAAQGHLDVVRDIVRKYPCKVRRDVVALLLIFVEMTFTVFMEETGDAMAAGVLRW